VSREQGSGGDVQIADRDAVVLLLGLSNSAFLACVGVLAVSIVVFSAVDLGTPALVNSVGILMLYAGRIATLAGGDVRVP